MADSDFVVSSKRKIREGEVAANKANSEAVNQVLAGNINSLIDGEYKVIEYFQPGYFSSSILYQAAPIYIPITTEIIRYELSVLDSGSSGTSRINFAVYDDSFAFIDNIFSTGDEPSITGANGTCLIGTDLISLSDYKIQNVAHTTDNGTVSLSTLQGGYILIPRITSFSTSARSIRLKLYTREQ